MIILLVAILPLYVIDIFAPCIDNSDWPSAPCYAPPEPSFNVIKKDWSQYYWYKGQDWMELKKSEMLESYSNGTLDKWLESGSTDQNQNVYYYYYLNDQIPSSEGKYASEEFANENNALIIREATIETGTITESDEIIGNKLENMNNYTISHDIDLIPFVIVGVFLIVGICAGLSLWRFQLKNEN